jgi:hypothetical protein
LTSILSLSIPPVLPQVLQSVLDQYRVPPELFAKVCIVVDKVDKLPREQVEKELVALGVAPETIDGGLGGGVGRWPEARWAFAYRD